MNKASEWVQVWCGHKVRTNSEFFKLTWAVANQMTPSITCKLICHRPAHVSSGWVSPGERGLPLDERSEMLCKISAMFSCCRGNRNGMLAESQTHSKACGANVFCTDVGLWVLDAVVCHVHTMLACPVFRQRIFEAFDHVPICQHHTFPFPKHVHIPLRLSYGQ